MLVIQRSLRKSATLVENREQTHKHNRLYSSADQGKSKKVPSAHGVRSNEINKFQYNAGTPNIFLQGKSVVLQHRPASQKNSAARSKHGSSPTENTQSKVLTLSSRSSGKYFRRRKTSGEISMEPPTPNVLNQEFREKSSIHSLRTIQQQRKRKARTPLLMNTMSLPNKNLDTLTSKEAPKLHLNREDAQATLEGLLATRNHQLPSTCGITSFSASDETRLFVDFKSTYLYDSYDYLFQRHLHNLNTVVNTYNQRERKNISQNNPKQKTRVDIYQNYCGSNIVAKHFPDSFCVDSNNCENSKASIPTDSKCCSCCINYSGQDEFKTRNQEISGRGIPVPHVRRTDDNSYLQSRASEGPVHHTRPCSEDHAANFRSSSRTCGAIEVFSAAMESRKVKPAASADTSGTRAEHVDKKNGATLCINVSNQFQDIHLEEVEPAMSKPVITLNHVSESFSGEKYEASVARSNRSPSPLLVVPSPADLQQESLRPPIE